MFPLTRPFRWPLPEIPPVSIGLEKSPDNLSFSFVLKDEANKEQTVFYNEPMPPDFTRSEKIVVIGGFQGDHFVASKILLKCPSKYQEQKLNARV
jgi:cytochrome c-type biogenesis protein CcmE